MSVQALNSKKPHPQRRLRLAVIGDRGSAYLRACVCAAAVGRGFTVSSFLGSFSLYQEMRTDEQSQLYAFRPDAVLLAVDPGQLWQARLRSAAVPSIAKQHLGASLIRSTILALFPEETDERIYHAKTSLLNGMQRELGEALQKENVCLSFPEERSESGVLVSWSKPPLWRRKKQNVPSGRDLLEGNHLGRVWCAVGGGLSYNCLMLDCGRHAQFAADNDLGALITKNYGSFLGAKAATGPDTSLDLLLMLDQNPLMQNSARRRNAVYTMIRLRVNN